MGCPDDESPIFALADERATDDRNEPTSVAAA
jgi:hypothetical protein